MMTCGGRERGGNGERGREGKRERDACNKKEIEELKFSRTVSSGFWLWRQKHQIPWPQSCIWPRGKSCMTANANMQISVSSRAVEKPEEL